MLDPMLPFDDAAPLAGGARIKLSGMRQKSTKSARHARVRDTSRAAYRSIGPAAGTQTGRILAAIIAAGEHGLTDDEGEAALGLKPQSYTPRRGELAAAKAIRDSGRTRPTSSGRGAVVWVGAVFGPATAGKAPHGEGGAS